MKLGYGLLRSSFDPNINSQYLHAYLKQYPSREWVFEYWIWGMPTFFLTLHMIWYDMIWFAWTLAFFAWRMDTLISKSIPGPGYRKLTKSSDIPLGRWHPTLLLSQNSLAQQMLNPSFCKQNKVSNSYFC